MNKLGSIKETLKDVINDEKDKKAGEILPAPVKYG